MSEQQKEQNAKESDFVKSVKEQLLTFDLSTQNSIMQSLGNELKVERDKEIVMYKTLIKERETAKSDYLKQGQVK